MGKITKETNPYKGILDEIKQQLMSEKYPKRRSLLMEAKEKFTILEKTGEYDPKAIKALTGLCVEIGLTSKRAKRRQKEAIENKTDAELWGMAEKDDVNAIMELSIRNGLTRREDWERIKRETEEDDEE